MSEVESTAQPVMTTASTTPILLPVTTRTSLPTLEITPIDLSQVTAIGGSGSTSHPAPTEPVSETTGASQVPSIVTEMASSQASGIEGVNPNNVNLSANSTTNHPPNPPLTPPPMPEIAITFLLITGKRRTMSFPPSTTIGRVKELVWNTWPADWSDDRPPTPSSLRILYLGKMLQDEDVLECVFFLLAINVQRLTLMLLFPAALHTLFPESQPGSSTPTIVHISIRPVASSTAGAADDLKKKKRVGVSMVSIGRVGVNSSGEGEEGDAGCRCVIC